MAELSIEQLKQERDRFVLFAFAAADILAEVGEDGKIYFLDGATMGLLGEPSEELIKQNFFNLVADDDLLRARSMLKRSPSAVRIDSATIHLRSALHGSLPFLLSGFKLASIKQHYYLTLALSKRDIPPEELARRDVYSGLLRKENYAETATKKIRESAEHGQSLKLTLLDFPELQAFLDSLPEHQAHELMAQISDYLRSKSIDGDTAGMINQSAYSFVHSPDVSPDQIMTDLTAITKQADPKGVGMKLRAETIIPDYTNMSEQDSAGALLYTINKFATESGDRFSLGTIKDGYQGVMQDTVAKIHDFKNIVSTGNFQVAFQPIVDLRTGGIHHFESLVRLNDTKSFGNPFQFITFGEQAGLIAEFDLAMFEKTFGILHRMKEKGQRPTVAVNVSGKSLSSANFMEATRQLMNKQGDVRQQIIFEVTESAKITDMEAANNFIQEMRQEGNLCCLDDFGVGESGFDYLRSLQVDFIKVDGSYVKESLTTPRGRHLLRAMIGLCRDLGINTIGEMVEDPKVATVLWDTGVQFGQGYLFGKPETNEDTLVNPNRVTSDYKGIVRARRFLNVDRKWWKKSE